MANRSRKTGGGRSAKKVVWFITIAALVVGFFGIPYDPGAKGIQEILVAKSHTVETWVGGIAPGVSNFINGIIAGGKDNPVKPGGGSNPGTPNGGNSNPGSNPGGNNAGATPGDASAVKAELNKLTVANAANVPYDRTEWKQWTNVRPCWNTREEVLYQEVVPGTAILKDKNGQVVSDVSQACEITGGTWVDPYTGDKFTNPKDLDIDHMVPLDYVNSHGGNSWDKAKKEKYANNLDYADHLIAVSAKANRAKGSKGPGDWRPSLQSYQCQYATDWVTVSATWGLSVTQKDKDALSSMLATCK